MAKFIASRGFDLGQRPGTQKAFLAGQNLKAFAAVGLVGSLALPSNILLCSKAKMVHGQAHGN